ncbi:MAG: cobalamin biosynthesis protein, partial [Oscillospiraceae bacterium]|nr:cobalamin biosynthesis protein [Oscillospiraceae bacterium]
MTAAIISVTEKGTMQSELLYEKIKAKGLKCKRFCYSKYASVGAESYENISILVKRIFSEYDILIFICACGIAVRSISPIIKSKTSDPGVIVMDEQLKYAIPILSGHLGGANRISQIISNETGAKAVITTATDTGEKFSVDSFAKANSLYISDMQIAKAGSAAVLQNKKIGFASDYGTVNLPDELSKDLNCEIGICISDDRHKKPFLCTLNLVPQNIVLGIGCKKGKTFKEIESFLFDFLKKNKIPLYKICRIATIDLKSNEKGILDFCKKYHLELSVYSAQELMSAEGHFTGSEFVKNVTGVDNVCESSAISVSYTKL